MVLIGESNHNIGTFSPIKCRDEFSVNSGKGVNATSLDRLRFCGVGGAVGGASGKRYLSRYSFL